MFKNDHIPLLTDLIEKGIEIKLSELGLDTGQDLILDSDDREEPQIDVTELTKLESNDVATADPLSQNPALEQAIRRILDEHMELALQEINSAIQQSTD
jgi:hypothetical protein